MSVEFDADTVSAPRLVVMKRGDGGYGFNLHGERNVQAGQTISAVDDGSEADKAGLRVGDKVIEVNGLNMEKMSHGDVVKRIKMNEKEVTMLVIDSHTEAYLKQEGRPITIDMANLMTCYQPKEVVSEPEPAQPAVVVEDFVPEVQESEAVETTPTPTFEPSEPTSEVEEVTNNVANEVDAGEAEVANEATTPEEVKQLNDVLDQEDEPAPAPTPESTPVLNNGTARHDEPEPEIPQPTPEPIPTPVPAPAPARPQAPVTKPTAKPLRSTIKQQKAESWDDKYKKFQQL